MIEVKEYLKKNRLLCDGALGTYYASLGNDGLSEKANIINPLQVEQIHLKYIESGANLIRTNTFSICMGRDNRVYQSWIPNCQRGC